MLKCPLCAKMFSKQSGLDDHVVTHTKEKPHKCPMCPEAYGLTQRLKQHIKIVHDGIKQTKNHHCTMCSYKCHSKYLLQVHVRKHSTELPFSCPRSGCGYRTKYKSYLSQHDRQVHSDKRPFKCPVDGCSYKAKIGALMGQHLRTHSNDKPFSCTVPGCNFTCKSKGELKSHTSMAHSDEKPFKCSVCEFRTKVRQCLRRHELQHTKFKRFQCQAPNCGFASHQRYDLKMHFDRKHRTNKVLCTESSCTFRCSSIILLKQHLKRHKLPILKCPSSSCGFRTKSNCYLRKHISSRHNDLQSAVTVAGKSDTDLNTAGMTKTLQCSFTDCSFQTKFRQHYDRHVVTHEKEEKNQHVCAFCYSRFNKFSELNTHVHRHIQEKPYSCSHCSYTALTRVQLRRHAKKIHQIQIHLIPRGKDDQVRMCHTCGKTNFSYGESVLHSMSHLQPVVVVEQLQLHVL